MCGRTGTSGIAATVRGEQLLFETSVLVKWFDTRGEDEVGQAQALQAAHVAGHIVVRLLDLAFYELGNVLLRRRGWPAADIAEQLEELRDMVGQPAPVSVSWTGGAASLGERHGLSYYDACWAAAAQHMGITLISADRQLLEAGLAESATSAASRLGLL